MAPLSAGRRVPGPTLPLSPGSAEHGREHGGPKDRLTIVSGARGHSRLREWAFGGLTRALIEESSIDRFVPY